MACITYSKLSIFITLKSIRAMFPSTRSQRPTAGAVQGSNHAQLQLAFDAHAGRVIVSLALDNLTKGTAGVNA